MKLFACFLFVIVVSGYSQPQESVTCLELVHTPAFEIALKGYDYYRSKGVITNDTIIVIDFDLPSSAERMFVYDVGEQKLLHASLVAHGKNSGEDSALFFSNEEDSYMSSVGFFLTAERYSGKHGLSYDLMALRKG